MKTFRKIAYLIASSILSQACFAVETTIDEAYLQSLEAIPRPSCIPVVPHGAVYDQEGYMQVSSCPAIHTQFLTEVFRKRPEPVEILDVCAGNSSAFRDVMNNAGPKPIRYTVVETQACHMDSMKTFFTQHVAQTATRNKWLGYAQKDLIEFCNMNPEKKHNKYDVVYAGFALHIFLPEDYVTAFDRLYGMLKPGGKMYLTQGSFANSGYTPEYIGQLRGGNILPFWTNPELNFCSDVRSMNRLAEAFGFNVQQSSLDVFLDEKQMATKYLAMILEKPLVERPGRDVTPYVQKAQQVGDWIRQR